ncbi:MAG: hypothetical protein KF796_19410 [Ramlibacter sp.]|nr:hypothetical protein [Ramlibacter sp.]
MHRIDSPDATPGGLYQAGNPALGQAATQVTAEALNALQEEIVAVILSEGLTLAKLNNTQLLEAINIKFGRTEELYWWGQI